MIAVICYNRRDYAMRAIVGSYMMLPIDIYAGRMGTPSLCVCMNRNREIPNAYVIVMQFT